MAQPLAPQGGNDKVYTPPLLARQICRHFRISGKVHEPCYGRGAFYNEIAALVGPENTSYSELDLGIDFLTRPFVREFDWIVTNPPWSQLRPFLAKSMGLADNIVFLCLVNAFFMEARLRDMRERGFGFKEILFVDTPEKPWPQTGFALGAVHIQRGYVSPCIFTHN